MSLRSKGKSFMIIGVAMLFLSVAHSVFGQNDKKVIKMEGLRKSDNVVKPAPRSVDKRPQPKPQSKPKAANDTLNSKNKTMVYLENSELLTFDDDLLPGVQLLKGNVKFRHDNAYLYCDSAYFFEAENSFNAYGNVKIVQGDTLFIYGDVLYYDGNIKLARLRENVRMINREVTLTTDSLDYDRENNVGYYFNEGKIRDKLNKLESYWGYYYPGQKMALFRKDVKLTNPNFIMNSDTLRYYTDTKIARILGPTTILYEKETTIYSENGWYNTENERSQLLDNSYVLHSDGKRLTGDTIFYDKKAQKGEVFSNMVLTDSARKVNLYGNYGYYMEVGEIGMATDSALIVEYSSADSVYMHADTLYTKSDSIYRHVRAYHNVRVFRKDVQAICDTAYYSSRDSILHLTKMPVMWSDNRQISGDTILMFTKNGAVDHARIVNNAIAVEREDSVKYNQMAGKEIIAYINDNQLRKVVVNGNAQSIYYPKEEDGTYVGINSLESSFMYADIKDKKIEKLVFQPAPIGSIAPIELASPDKLYLKNFSWQIQYRPVSPDDVFTLYVRKENDNKENKQQRRRGSDERDKEKKNTEEEKSVTAPKNSSSMTGFPGVPSGMGGSSTTLKPNR